MVLVRIIQPGGDMQEMDATVGDTLMESAKAEGIDGIEAECGGSMVCGTCHIHIGEQWFERIGAPSGMEAEILEYGLHMKPTSRLSCQVTVTAEMEGLEIEMPPSQR